MSHHASRLVVVLTALAILAFTGTATAQSPKVEVKSGSTTLSLDPGTATALTDAGIAVKPIGDAKAGSDGIAFPVVGGWLTTDPVGGRIHHLGGLRLRSDDATVRLRNFVVRLDEDPDLTATVGDSRVSILDLDLSQAQVSLEDRRLKASGVIATLSADGAAALNAAFGLQLSAGLPIGTANVDARLAKPDRDEDDDEDDDRDDDDRDDDHEDDD
jgi:hypothetical protein